MLYVTLVGRDLQQISSLNALRFLLPSLDLRAVGWRLPVDLFKQHDRAFGRKKLCLQSSAIEVDNVNDVDSYGLDSGAAIDPPPGPT